MKSFVRLSLCMYIYIIAIDMWIIHKTIAFFKCLSVIYINFKNTIRLLLERVYMVTCVFLDSQDG